MSTQHQLKPWRERANTIGYISGGTEAQAFLLEQILKNLPCAPDDVITWKNPAGKGFSARCDDLCRSQLSSAGLVERAVDGRWNASAFANEWASNKSPAYLAAQLHDNVKYFGELLAEIGDSTTQNDLLEAAKSSYGLNWSSLDQVRRRTGWLRSLGMVELWGLRIVRTEAGDAFLASIETCSSVEALGQDRKEESIRIDPDVEQFLTDLPKMDQEGHRGRRALIGYIPKGAKSSGDSEGESLTPSSSLRKLIGMLGDGKTVDEFQGVCGDQLGISKASFQMMMHTLRHAGIIEQTSLNNFSATTQAYWLTDAGNEKALVGHLHARYSFFGEILKHLKDPATTSFLTGVAKERYGYAQASNGEIRLRLGFLQDAGLVERVDWQRFRTTSTGEQFKSFLSMQPEVTEGDSVGQDSHAKVQSEGNLLEVLLCDLEAFGRDGNESKSFEVAVARAFQYLGFHTEHLGGPGRTDVLAVAQLAQGDRYRVIVDSKSSGNGIVAESSVKFDALRDHKRKHGADHVVVVGPDFATRLKNWAVENEVAMLTLEDLSSTLKRHSVNPISITDMREAFARPDNHRDELDGLYDSTERRSMILQRILDLSVQEAIDDDPIAAGYVSPENMIYALRKEISPRPSSSEIEELLAFLTSPLVGALEESRGRYKLADSPHNVALRLRGLGSSIATGGER
ncbi:hypothetical protein ACFVYP_18360 [Kitasatospora sp. NPDC058201]|uniref:hypothetical protein n=1 Tax=unclassified Kitasatospora TaxID=2633591 RepID=UPI00365D27E8